MTADTTALQERIEAALVRATDDGADRTEDYAAAVLPIIRKAERDAARAALDGLAAEAREGIVLHETTWGYGQSIAYAAETYRDTHHTEETP